MLNDDVDMPDEADLSDEFNTPVEEVTDWKAPNRRRNTVDVLSRLPAFRTNPAPDGSPWGPDLYNPLEDKNHPFKDEAQYQRAIKPFYRRRNPMHNLDNDMHNLDRGLDDSLMPARRMMRRRNFSMHTQDRMPSMPFRGRHFNRRNPYARNPLMNGMPMHRHNPRGVAMPWRSRSNPRTMFDPLFRNPAMPWRNRSNPRMMFDPLFRNPAMPWRGRSNPAMPWRNRSNPRMMFDPLFRNPAMPWRNRSNPHMRGPFDPLFARHNPVRRASMPWRNPRTMFDPLFKRNLRRRSNPLRNPEQGVGLYRSIFSRRRYL